MNPEGRKALILATKHPQSSAIELLCLCFAPLAFVTAAAVYTHGRKCGRSFDHTAQTGLPGSAAQAPASELATMLEAAHSER